MIRSSLRNLLIATLLAAPIEAQPTRRVTGADYDRAARFLAQK